MNKEQIISEIQRTAKTNGGVALGWKRFKAETGIGYHDWYGLWPSWNDAVREAGVTPNRMSEAYSDEYLLEKLVLLTRSLHRVPVAGDLRVAAKNNSAFPSDTVFSRLGVKAQRVARVIAFCETHSEYSDVANLWRQIAIPQQPQDSEEVNAETLAVGYVYMLKHGVRREYKIGRTYNPLRREGEIGIQLPEKIQPIYYIKTDDPAGIENYWHMRFANKRKEGEWFALTSEDVRAFKRWKRIY